MEAPAANASQASVNKHHPFAALRNLYFATLQTLTLSQSDLIQDHRYLHIRAEKHMKCGEQHSKGHIECS